MKVSDVCVCAHKVPAEAPEPFKVYSLCEMQTEFVF